MILFDKLDQLRATEQAGTDSGYGRSAFYQGFGLQRFSQLPGFHRSGAGATENKERSLEFLAGPGKRFDIFLGDRPGIDGHIDERHAKVFRGFGEICG